LKRKVVVAMSGGVDSSVTAALLIEAGHEVVGVTMRMWGEPEDSEPSIAAAAETCRILGISHKVLDVREGFAKDVIGYFLDEYAAGLTPNPCIRCNELIKFGLMRKLTDLLKGERLATGHYVRALLDIKSDRFLLKKALDENKDQSYFLYRLSQAQIGLSIFPLGDMTKDEVRDKARGMGLPAAWREESQEVCFIPANDYRAFIEDERPEAVREGEFVDKDGNVLGRHRGVAFYTIGQRRGHGVSSSEGRMYVIDRDPVTNRIVLGSLDELKRSDCVVGSVKLISMESLEGPLDVTVKHRYRCRPAPATIEPVEHGNVRIRFRSPVTDGIAPGQSAVFYDGNTVVGGGVILRG